MDQGAEVLNLPASLAAERSVLGMLLLKSDLWSDAAEALRPEDFSLDCHQRIFRAMVDVGRSQGSFDAVTLAARLERELPNIGGEAYLTELECGAVERKNINPFCNIIRENAGLRRVARQAEALQTAALQPGTTLEECRRQMSELLTLCDGPQSNRLRACPLGEFLSLDIPVREMVLAPVLPAQGLAMLYSKRGVGKTYLALGIALAVARGGSFLRWNATKPRKVLFVDGELPATTLQQRIRSIQEGVPESEPQMPAPDFLRIITPDMQNAAMPDLSTPQGQILVEREIADADLLVLDNLSALCRSGKENEGESWLPVQEWLLRLRQQHRSVLLVHHAGKSGAQRGTSRREDLLDTVIALQHPSDYIASEGLRCEIRYEKARSFLGDEAKPFEPECRWKARVLRPGSPRIPRTPCSNAQSLCSVTVKPCEARGRNWAYPVVRPHALGRRHKSKGCWTVVLSRCLKGRHWDRGTNPKSGTQRWDIGRDTLSGHIEASSLKKRHSKAVRLSKVRPFVLYSMRHTFLTRLGESGCDAWTLARIAGHTSIAMSARYVHPSEDAVLTAISRLGGHKIGHSAIVSGGEENGGMLLTQTASVK